MKRTFCVGPFGLAGDNQNTSLRKLRGKIVNPADAVVAFQERLDEKEIGPLLSNDLVCLSKTVGGAADMISGVAPNNCSHAPFANNGVTYHNDPAWLSPPTRADRCFQN